VSNWLHRDAENVAAKMAVARGNTPKTTKRTSKKTVGPATSTAPTAVAPAKAARMMAGSTSRTVPTAAVPASERDAILAASRDLGATLIALVDRLVRPRLHAIGPIPGPGRLVTRPLRPELA
jgi:hypothetical protein